MVGLQQRYLGWSPGVPSQPSSVRPQLCICSSVDCQSYHSDRITDTLVSFHWPRAPARIKLKLAIMVYRGLPGTAANMPTRGRLRSSTSGDLDVRPSSLVIVRDRSYATAAPRLWNSLTNDVQSAFSLTTFIEN